MEEEREGWKDEGWREGWKEGWRDGQRDGQRLEGPTENAFPQSASSAAVSPPRGPRAVPALGGSWCCYGAGSSPPLAPPGLPRDFLLPSVPLWTPHPGPAPTACCCLRSRAAMPVTLPCSTSPTGEGPGVQGGPRCPGGTQVSGRDPGVWGEGTQACGRGPRHQGGPRYPGGDPDIWMGHGHGWARDPDVLSHSVLIHLGYGRGELLGRSWYRLLHPEDLGHVARQHLRLGKCPSPQLSPGSPGVSLSPFSCPSGSLGSSCPLAVLWVPAFPRVSSINLVVPWVPCCHSACPPPMSLVSHTSPGVTLSPVLHAPVDPLSPLTPCPR